MSIVNPLRGTVLLAATAGYVDTLGFVALFGLFTAHVTGNFVLIGTELVRSGHGVLLKLLVFPAFLAAVALSRLIHLRCEQAQRSSVQLLLAIEAILLSAFAIAGIYASPLTTPNSLLAIVAGVAGGMAMGFQNGMGRQALTKHAPTTMMTGNVTQLVIDMVDLMAGDKAVLSSQRIGKQLWPITGFALGALGGAFGYAHLGFCALALPIVAVTLLACDATKLAPQTA